MIKVSNSVNLKTFSLLSIVSQLCSHTSASASSDPTLHKPEDWSGDVQGLGLLSLSSLSTLGRFRGCLLLFLIAHSDFLPALF